MYIAIASITSSCGIYRKYPKQTKVGNDLFGKEYVSTDSSSVADLSWKQMFTDPYLQVLIDSALVKNTDLNIAFLRTQQTEAALMNAKLSYLPSLELVGNKNWNKMNGTRISTYNIGGQTAWEVDIFGKLTNAKRGARESLEASIAYKQAVKAKVISTVAFGYYTLLMLDKQLTIGRETLINWNKTIHTLEVLKRNSNYVTDAAVLQAKANRISLEGSLLSIEKNIKETENMLCTVLAIPPVSIERGDLEEQSFPKELSVGMPVQILSNRPDVCMAEHRLAQAFYATNAARAAFYPSINLSGSTGWTNDGGGVVLDPAGWLLNAVSSLVQPLFCRSSLVANLKVAKAEQEAAKLEFKQSLLNAGTEVNNAMKALQTARKKLISDATQVKILKETIRKTELLMHHSSTTYLEVLTAQQSLLEARQAWTESKLDEIKSIITLYHALGGGK